MSDAANNIMTQRKAGELLAIEMDGAAQTIYAGTLVMRDASGYGVKAANTASCIFAGVAYEKKVIATTETDGTTRVRCWQTGLFRLAISSVAVTNIGSWVYASDNQTVTLTAGYVPVGVIRAIEGSTWVWIDIAPALATANQEPHDHSSAAQGGGLTSPHITTGIEDSGGNEIFKFTATASAVNEITIANAATGNGPTLTASGETNVPITLAGKGTGAVQLGQATSVGVALLADQPILDSAANELVKFTKATTAVNELTIANAATGNPPSIIATGGDTNVGLAIDVKAAGVLTLGSADAKLAFFDGAGAVQQDHIADPSAGTAADITDSTGGTPSGTHTLVDVATDTWDNEKADVENNFATIAAEYNLLKDCVEANNTAIDSILAVLEAYKLVKTS